MANRDLNDNHSVTAAPDASSSRGANQETFAPYDSEKSDQKGSSQMDQQVDAAVRDVENLLLKDNRFADSSGMISGVDIDWSIPDLFERRSPESQTPTELETESRQAITSGGTFISPAELEARESIRNMERRIAEITKARERAESKLLIKLETEAKIQAEAVARRREEEELRKLADEEAARRHQEDDIKLRVQREKIVETERELQGFWDEERRLRADVLRLNHKAHEVLLAREREEERAKLALLAEARRSRDLAETKHIDSLAKLHTEEESLRRAVARFDLRRTEVEAERHKHETELRRLEAEKKQLEIAEAARLAERKRIREEAEDRLRLEQEILTAQEKELARRSETLAQQRAELDLARRNAEQDSLRLAEARARMQAAEEASQQAERERLALEAHIFERAERERHMLEEVRVQAETQLRQLELNAQEKAEYQARRIAELEALRISTEGRVQLQVGREQHLNNELISIQLAEQTTLEHIEELEAQCKTANESHARRLEKLKQVETEMHARAVREAQTRADIERRIKEETEQLKRLEVEHLRRIEDEVSRRSEAEKRLREMKERYQAEQAARIKSELGVDLNLGSGAGFDQQTPKPYVPSLPDDESAPDDFSAPEPALEIDGLSRNVDDNVDSVYQVGNLSSSDARQRADAVITLARLGANDSFDLIASCFDDESPLVRNAAARAMLSLDSAQPAETFTRALKDASSERQSRIGRAIAESGLAAQAISSLSSDDRKETYKGLCLLFTMARTGEVEPLVHAVEKHEDAEVRLAAIRLLKMSGKEDLATAAANRRIRPKA